ncbi:hypothetical protein FKR81_19945 [Lentzea tibetensis]|uniref:Uncharacterized protein n=1 Tax=Lentzea tibetensis TaxID=2591470 RepID=A0A563ES84_9PSEU|nr:hypothetical protein [Lentzea tibetensis]TWP50452.1 hypothetical protein FKR81_19945 [Lentzea tibetensis]
MATTTATPRHLHLPDARRGRDPYSGAKGVHHYPASALLPAPRQAYVGQHLIGAEHPRYVGSHREELG